MDIFELFKKIEKKETKREKPGVRALGVACQRGEEAYNWKFKRGTVSAAFPAVFATFAPSRRRRRRFSEARQQTAVSRRAGKNQKTRRG
jgi:hypothetical protein